MQNELDALQLKKRHSHIDPDPINKIKDDFLQELSELEKRSICVNSEDSIQQRCFATPF